MEIYKITKSFPVSEQFGIISQLRRASLSIPSNIAEGSKRSTDKSYASFLRISLGSGAEIETQLYIAKELEYISEKDYSRLMQDLSEIMKMLSMFIKKVV
ncbi:MAG: four helix bundle protein [Candidatus Pacebacteria bacterium]|nr:four helix bundle protein [Candidatus Paceibacterota bacterium]